LEGNDPPSSVSPPTGNKSAWSVLFHTWMFSPAHGMFLNYPRGVKRPGRERDHSSPSSGEWMELQSLPLYDLRSALFWDMTRRGVVIFFTDVSVPSSRVDSLHTTPRKIPEERRSYQYRGGSFKSRRIRKLYLRYVVSYSAGNNTNFRYLQKWLSLQVNNTSRFISTSQKTQHPYYKLKYRIMLFKQAILYYENCLKTQAQCVGELQGFSLLKQVVCIVTTDSKR
jgi:hypothetical protein